MVDWDRVVTAALCTEQVWVRGGCSGAGGLGCPFAQRLCGQGGVSPSPPRVLPLPGDVLTVPSCQLSPSVSTDFEWQPQLLPPTGPHPPPGTASGPPCSRRAQGAAGVGRWRRPFLGLSASGHLSPPGHVAPWTALFRARCRLACPLPRGRECGCPPHRHPRAPGAEAGSAGQPPVCSGAHGLPSAVSRPPASPSPPNHLREGLGSRSLSRA